MFDILKYHRAQYWYWFVRDRLISLELESNVDSKKVKRFNQLIKAPLTTRIYSDAAIGKKLSELDPYSNFDSEFNNNGKDYRTGNRGLPQHLWKRVNNVIPNSAQAFTDGPAGLFLIFEAKNLTESACLIAKVLLTVLEAEQEVFKDDSQLLGLKKLLSNRVQFGIFGGTIKLLNTIEDIINYLYPTNDWDKFVPVVSSVDSSQDEFDPDKLLKPKYFELVAIAPIVIGFGFFRAKFFDEVHYLSKVCYQEQYLKLLHNKFLIKEEHWLFESRNRKEDIDLTTNVREESILKNLFLQASAMAHPTCLADAFREKQ
ncbi:MULTISPECIES: hypothetical protein [Pseudoalteromonas]|uniref:hypothetical protein n=1 Tax=Pseudoalteromonas TaxID=53246 RepID=UPI001581C65D|nr:MULTISPECIES: hypothetical protein [Pseudoalteromonas]MDI4653815.1 hypothetical protein [Pseudoalteromonas shioyasakiensis]NUJ40025.1 hypothetical protein [Pseudoalteromonas sp. 0303]